jgi:hypothetical protein
LIWCCVILLTDIVVRLFNEIHIRIQAPAQFLADHPDLQNS